MFHRDDKSKLVVVVVAAVAVVVVVVAVVVVVPAVLLSLFVQYVSRFIGTTHTKSMLAMSCLQYRTFLSLKPITRQFYHATSTEERLVRMSCSVKIWSICLPWYDPSVCVLWSTWCIQLTAFCSALMVNFWKTGKVTIVVSCDLLCIFFSNLWRLLIIR